MAFCVKIGRLVVFPLTYQLKPDKMQITMKMYSIDQIMSDYQSKTQTYLRRYEINDTDALMQDEFLRITGFNRRYPDENEDN